MKNTIDLFAPEVRVDPYPAYANLRASGPQPVDPGGVWAITRFEDVQFALKHPELFSSAGFEALYKPAWLPYNPLGDSLLTREGDAHTKLRTLVSRAFTPRSLTQLEPRIETIAAECVDELVANDEINFITEFAASFPAKVIAEILGLNPSLHREFQRWVDTIALISPVVPSPEIADRIRTTIAELEGYFRAVVDTRRREPQEDMVSDLVRAEIDGVALSDQDLVAFLFILLPAGFETTRHFFANAMMAFCEHPEYVENLRANPERIPAFVEELLRHQPPVHGVMRMTTQEVEVGEARIPAGSLVWLLLGAANRDEDRFAAASDFDISRDSQGGLAFGHGVHFCLGAPLARIEARLGLAALLDRFSDFELVSRDISWNLAPTVRGPNELRVRLRSAPRP